MRGGRQGTQRLAIALPLALGRDIFLLDGVASALQAEVKAGIAGLRAGLRNRCAPG